MELIIKLIQTLLRLRSYGAKNQIYLKPIKIKFYTAVCYKI